MNKKQVRDLVHNIINFTNDGVGRELAESTTPAWGAQTNVDLLTDEQAQALLVRITEIIRQSAFSVLAKS